MHRGLTVIASVLGITEPGVGTAAARALGIVDSAAARGEESGQRKREENAPRVQRHDFMPLR